MAPFLLIAQVQDENQLLGVLVESLERLEAKLEEAREKFEDQAINLSQQGVKVRAVVLNTALR